MTRQPLLVKELQSHPFACLVSPGESKENKHSLGTETLSVSVSLKRIVAHTFAAPLPSISTVSNSISGFFSVSSSTGMKAASVGFTSSANRAIVLDVEANEAGANACASCTLVARASAESTQTTLALLDMMVVLSTIEGRIMCVSQLSVVPSEEPWFPPHRQ